MAQWQWQRHERIPRRYRMFLRKILVQTRQQRNRSWKTSCVLCSAQYIETCQDNLYLHLVYVCCQAGLILRHSRGEPCPTVLLSLIGPGRRDSVDRPAYSAAARLKRGWEGAASKQSGSPWPNGRSVVPGTRREGAGCQPAMASCRCGEGSAWQTPRESQSAITLLAAGESGLCCAGCAETAMAVLAAFTAMLHLLGRATGKTKKLSHASLLKAGQRQLVVRARRLLQPTCRARAQTQAGTPGPTYLLVLLSLQPPTGKINRLVAQPNRLFSSSIFCIPKAHQFQLSRSHPFAPSIF